MIRKKEDERKMVPSDGILPTFKRERESYVICDRITITIREMQQAADISLRTALAASFESELGNIFKVSTTKHFDVCAQGSFGMRYKCWGCRGANIVWEF